MREIDEIGIRGIPKESKLFILGDWYQKPGEAWKVVCYFHNDELGYFRKALSIDLLPVLTPGAVFPKTSTENKAQGWTETVKLPKKASWHKVCFGDLPESLKRAHKFSDQFNHGVLYRIETGQKIYWLPLTEVARMLFFHSSEVVRAAAYQGNIWQLGKAWSEDWVGKVELSANIPVRYMNSLQFRKFFSWLFFDAGVEDSFCSIYQVMNRNLRIVNGAERWTFDFTPPDLSHCEISLAGFTGRELEENQVFIREIRSVSGLKSPDLDVVFFSHPDDDMLLEREPEKDSNDKPETSSKSWVDIQEIDPDSKPKAASKRHLVKLGRSRLNFDVEPDTRRSPRYVKALPAKIEPDLDDVEEQTPEELASLQQGSDKGKGLRADVDNLDPPELIDAPEKLLIFQAMLRKLKNEYGWEVESQIGDVPKKRCRSQHLIGDRARRYCHAIVKRDTSTKIQILEIELTNKVKKDGTVVPECLSTLFFRVSDTTSTFQKILDELMSSHSDEELKAMAWKRKFNSQCAMACAYLGHPEKKIKNGGDALASWVNRSAELILSL
ncbi:MAG: hypothetical protein JXR18_14045 [Neptuniibacter sp.]